MGIGADFATDGFPMHGITDPAHIADVLAAWGYLGVFIAVFVGNLGIPVKTGLELCVCEAPAVGASPIQD